MRPPEEFEPAEPPSEGREPRRRLVDFTRRDCRQRRFIGTGGSLPARAGRGSFVVTPYGVDRHTLGVEDLALVRGGRAEAGQLPSRAARPHRAIYARHPRVGAVLNASPVNVTAFSVTRAALEAFDRLGVPESTSEALADGRLVGEVAPVSEEVIDELRRALASMPA